MSLSKHLPSRYETYICHLCESGNEICQKTEALITKVLTNPLSFVPSSDGKLTKKAKKQISQLQLIHEIEPQLKEATEEFRRNFKHWSKHRQEAINEMTKCVGQVIKAKTGTNVVKACGKVTGIISGIIAIAGVILAPETGGLSLTAWGLRASLAARALTITSHIADGIFSHIQSKRVRLVLEKDRRETEKMEKSVNSLMTTSKLFFDVVDEFEKQNQWFGMSEITEELQNFKAEYNQAKTALDVVEKAIKSGVKTTSSALTKGMACGLIGIHVIMETVDLIKTIGDLKNGSRSDLEEHILALTAVLVREHDILEKQYNSLCY